MRYPCVMRPSADYQVAIFCSWLDDKHHSQLEERPTHSRSVAYLIPPPPPTVSIVRGHGYTTITLFLVHDVIMACVRSRYEHLDITEPSCGRNNEGQIQIRKVNIRYPPTRSSCLWLDGSVSLDITPLLQLVARSGSRSKWLPVSQNKFDAIIIMIVMSMWCWLPTFIVFLLTLLSCSYN